MESWIIWEQVCRVMAALFMVTSLAAAAAALILLVREDLAKRFGRELGNRYLRRLGLLVMLAVGVWILVIGQSARAAEDHSNRSAAGEGTSLPGTETAEKAEKIDPERASETEPPADAGEGAGKEPEDPGEGQTRPPETPGEGSTQPPEPVIEDTLAPSVAIRMTDEVNRDGRGIANCRSDNAGVAVTFSDDREDDLGIRSCRITVGDHAGNEIAREWSRGEEEESRGRIELTVDTEEIAGLADGRICVKAQAEDEAGNMGESELVYTLDTCAPLVTEIMTYGSGEEGADSAQPYGAGSPVAERTIYDGRDLYYRDRELTTKIQIEEENEVSWEISFLELPDPGAEGGGKSIDRQKRGSGHTGEVTVTKEGVYGGWRISGEDIAGNRLRAADGCRCTQDTEDFEDSEGGICLSRRKILDRTAPEAQIRYSSGADGYRYMEKDGETVYFAGDVKVTMRVQDRCGEWDMPVDEKSCRLVRWTDPDQGGGKTPPREAGGESYAVSDDGKVWFGAYGTDRAGNGLTVREVFDEGVIMGPGGGKKSGPYEPDSVRVKQRDADGCLPGTGIVRDTVRPVLAASVSAPSGNPAGTDTKEKIVYYGDDSALYENGRKEVRVSFEVTDQNADGSSVEIRTAYEKVQEGQFCGQVLPTWEKAAKEEVTASVYEGRLLFELVKIPGTEAVPDGVYRFGIAGTDKAGNPLTADAGQRGKDSAICGAVCEDSAGGIFMTGRKVVDTKAPAGEIRIMNTDGEEYYRTSAHRSAWTADREGFMPYRRETAADVVWSVRDTSPAAISFRVVSTLGRRAGGSRDGTEYRNNPGGTVQIRGGQVFRLEQAQLRDRAGNCSAVLPRTVNFYLDTQIPDIDIDTPSVTVTAQTSITARSPDGRDLYGGGVHLKIHAQDPDAGKGASGLREVRYDLRVDGRAVREGVLLFSADTEEAAGAGKDAALDAEWKEQDPVYSADSEVYIPSGGEWESNDIEITVTAQDNAGNTSSPEGSGSYRFGIDSTGPSLTVAYDNNDVRNSKYFAKPRKAVITALERNFSARGIRVAAPGAQTGPWQFVRRGPDGDSDVWAMEVVFGTDGEYTLEVDGKDALGNTASAVYTGEAPQSFVVDQTPPVIDVVWDNQDVRNGVYYNRPRRALVRITELSFDARAVKILPVSGAFRKTADAVFETEILYSEEGEWNLHCSCADLAGNAAIPVSGDPFVIDRTPPIVYFDRDSVEEMGVYGEEIRPRVRWEEENPSGDCYAVWSNLTARGRTMACRRGVPGKTNAFELPDLPQIREADGVCVLSAGMCDLAGNRTCIRRNLSVNRFGSVYDIRSDPGTLEMVSDYYTDAAEPFVVTEYNVSPLVSRDVTIFKNGAARLLKEGEDYHVTEEKNPAGFRYVYRIDPAAFHEEGTYSILLQSKDETGRQNSSPGRFSRGEEEEYSPSWAVDRTPPTLRLAGIDTQRDRFMTDSVSLSLIPSDNLELSGLCVRILDDRGGVLREEKLGKEELRAVLDKNRGEVPVRVEASREWQTLEAYVTDGAGLGSSGMLIDTASEGEEVLQGYRLLVSASPIVYIYRSGLLPALAFLALVGTIGFTKAL